MNTEKKSHWETVYSTKQANEVSWTEEIPQTSLNFIRAFQLHKSVAIIDIGGGDSRLVDFLLEEGYTDLTVLDISEAALERAKARLGERAPLVQWIVCDITEFNPEKKYTVWHDRATFHFLTTPEQIQAYLSIAGKAVEGYITLGTFSKNGPKKCSGLDIRQYSEQDLESAFAHDFQKLRCIEENHTTPFHTLQNFTFCSFSKK